MATTNTMTTRDFLTAVISANISAGMNAKAQEMIDALDRKNDKRKATGTKTQQANAEIKENILAGMIVGTVYTAKEVATTYELSSTQKASALLSQLVKAGKLTTEEVKTKSGKVVGYKLKENKDSGIEFTSEIENLEIDFTSDTKEDSETESENKTE